MIYDNNPNMRGGYSDPSGWQSPQQYPTRDAYRQESDQNPLQQIPRNIVYWISSYQQVLDWPVNPGDAVMLMHQNGEEFYTKVGNAWGPPTIEIYDCKKRETGPQYVTTAQLGAVIGKLDQLTAMIQQSKEKDAAVQKTEVPNG